jgi:hypothetical protein
MRTAWHWQCWWRLSIVEASRRRIRLPTEDRDAQHSQIVTTAVVLCVAVARRSALCTWTKKHEKKKGQAQSAWAWALGAGRWAVARAAPCCVLLLAL